MKFIAFIIALIVARSTYAQDSVKLSGRIDNMTSDSISVVYNDNYLAYYPKTFYATLDKKGNFSLAFPIPAHVYTQAEIHYANKIADVVFRSKDSVHLTVNFLHFDSTITYAGKGAEVQNFVAHHTLTMGRMNQYTVPLKTAMTEEPEKFLEKINKLKKIEMTFLDKYRGRLPVSFNDYWKAFYNYYNYFFIQQYPQTHEMIKLKRITDTVPDENYMVVKEMPYAFNDSFLQLPPYLLYLTGVFDTKLKAAGYKAYRADPQTLEAMEDSVYTLGYKLLPDKSAEFMMAQNLYGRAKDQPIARTQHQYDVFKKHWPQSQYLSLIDKQFAVAKRLAPGQPAPDFDINTPDGKHVKLSDLKGSVIFIGFWGSFCRQCVGEMMAEKKVKDAFEGKPVKFVYISIDNDAATDVTIAKKYHIPGIYTHADNGWNSKETELYGVQNLPAYFLIDEEGNIAIQHPPSPVLADDLIREIQKLIK